MATLSELIASAPEHLHPNLAYDVGPAASYVLSRSQQTFVPVGGDTYSPNGSRLIRFNLPTAGFIDPTTVKIRFELHNDTAFPDYNQNGDVVAGNGALLSQLMLNGPPGIIFSRARSLANGALISDLQQCNRICFMYHYLLRDRMKAVDDQMEMGMWCSKNTYDGIYNGNIYGAVPSNGKRTFQIPCDLFSPLLSQTLYLPAKELALQLELELVSTMNEVVIQQLYNQIIGQIGAQNIPQSAPASLLPQSASYSWHIERVQLQCDVIQLTSDFSARINSLLLNSSLPIPCVMMASQIQTIANQNLSNLQVICTRSFSRLRAILFSFSGTCPSKPLAASPYLNQPYSVAPWDQYFHNTFICPLGGLDESVLDQPIEWFINIGGQQWPVRPCSGQAETFWRLKQALDQPVRGSLNIDPVGYNNNQWILGQNFLKAGGGGNWSGQSTTAGETLVLNFKNLQDQIEAGSWGQSDLFTTPAVVDYPPPLLQQLHVLYIADCVVSVGAAGTAVQY